MRFKLDANLGQRGAVALRADGHDVETATLEGLASAPDVEIAEACRREQRILATLDTDFANPLRYPPEHYFGIVVIRLGRAGTVADIERALLAFARTCADSAVAGNLFIADPAGRIRVFRRDASGEPGP